MSRSRFVSCHLLINWFVYCNIFTTELSSFCTQESATWKLINYLLDELLFGIDILAEGLAGW
jgi:hypothetical protein